MRVLFDQGVPVPLRDHLTGHRVSTAFEMGWDTLANGELLSAAEAAVDAFITTDKNLRHQQNLAGRALAILVLPTTNWPKIQRHVATVVAAVNALRSGDFHELAFPDGP